MKKRLTFLIAIMLIALTSCGNLNSTPTTTTDEPSTTIIAPSDDNQTTKEDETANMELTLKIDGTEIYVI